MRPKALLSAVLGCALVWVVSAADAQNETEIKSNDQGEITLKQPTRVGGLMLQPDTYVLQHQESHGQHSIRFMKVRREKKLVVTRAYTGWNTETELIKAGEVKCRVQPLGAKAQATIVKVATENETPRITEAMLKGKEAVYVF